MKKRKNLWFEKNLLKSNIWYVMIVIIMIVVLIWNIKN